MRLRPRHGPSCELTVLCCGAYRASTPTMLHYKSLLGSMYNTPPCWTIYVCGLVFQHMLDLGGLEVVQRNNVIKAKVRRPVSRV